MSLENFIPKVWSTKLLKQLDEQHILVGVCNRDYEGDIAEKGDTVKINAVGDITIKDYVKGDTSISPEELSDASTELTIDQAKYFSFGVEDIDKMQSNIDYTTRAQEKASIGLRDTADSYVAGLYTGAGITPAEEDWSSTVDVQSAAKKIKLDLMKNDVPESARIFWAVSPTIYTDALSDLVTDLTDNVSELRNGVVGSVYGIDILVSNNLEGDGSDSTPFQTMAGTYDAMGYAEQMSKVEGYRPEDNFSDAVKGLHVYGAKVIRPEQLVSLPVQTS